jgi:outer membrane protein assembly factor BamB
MALDDRDGTILWERTISGKGYQRITAIAVDTTPSANGGAIYLGGLFKEGLEVNGSEYVPQSATGNLFIARLTP